MSLDPKDPLAHNSTHESKFESSLKKDRHIHLDNESETSKTKKIDTNEVIRKAKEAELERNKKRLLRKEEILAEYGNLESMIPLGHEYWTLSS